MPGAECDVLSKHATKTLWELQMKLLEVCRVDLQESLRHVNRVHPIWPLLLGFRNIDNCSVSTAVKRRW